MTTSVDELKARLYTRTTKVGAVFCLDLRAEQFGRLAERFGRKTIYDPRTSGWPLGRGRGTTDKKLMESWLDDYANWIESELRGDGARDGGFLLTSDAADQYLSRLATEKGARHNTLINRRSAVKCHIEPAVGDELLSALSAAKVQAFADGMMVERWRDGRRTIQSAGPETIQYALTTLNAIWHYHYQSRTPPWKGAKVRAGDAWRERMEAARDGRILGSIQCYSADELSRLLEVATKFDRKLLGDRANAARSVGNTAPFIAFLIYTGARVAEATMMRWSFVCEDLGVLYLPGTKTSKAPRWIPIQHGLCSWLDSLRTAAGMTPDPAAWLFPSSPDSAMPAVSTHQGHVRKALREAGLKREGSNTKIFRKSHTTFATRSGYDRQKLQIWLGHSDGSLVSERYLDRYGLASLIEDEDRSYIPVIPVP